MSESEETEWRLGVNPEDEKKGELQQTVQAKAEEIGGGGEGSLVAKLSEEEPITEAPKKEEPKAKAKGPSLKKRETDTGKNMANISKQVERQANQLIRIEKATVSLQKSINKIDKQLNTIRQLNVALTQLQRHVRSSKNRKQNQSTEKKKVGKNLPRSSRERHIKGRR